MKKTIIASILASVLSLVSHAEVRTYQGSQRWNTTLFTPNVATGRAITNYTSYTVVEFNGDDITNQVKIDVWSARNPYTNVLERRYFIDTNFNIEYSLVHLRYTQVAGGMQFSGFDSVIPFRGTVSYGDLGAFSLYHTSGYYREGSNVDITEITGSGRLNLTFSGATATMDDAVDTITDYLHARGYSQAFTR